MDVRSNAARIATSSTMRPIAWGLAGLSGYSRQRVLRGGYGCAAAVAAVRAFARPTSGDYELIHPHRVPYVLYDLDRLRDDRDKSLSAALGNVGADPNVTLTEDVMASPWRWACLPRARRRGRLLWTSHRLHVLHYLLFDLGQLLGGLN